MCPIRNAMRPFIKCCSGKIKDISPTIEKINPDMINILYLLQEKILLVIMNLKLNNDVDYIRRMS